MRVGNLTYHFPSKRELLLAVITRLLAFYTERFDAIFASADVSATEGFARLVRWLLEDAIDAADRKFKAPRSAVLIRGTTRV